MQPGDRWRLALTAVFVMASLALVRITVRFVEARHGVTLADPVLAAFAPIDLNSPIFVLVYGSIGLGIAALARTPGRLLLGLQAYGLLMLLRCATLWLVPLQAPPDMIVLHDPIVRTFLQAQRPAQNDLFFSGHVATTFLLFLLCADGSMKQLLLVATFLIAVLIALQHVHYTIDLVAAPFFALGSYRAVLLVTRRS
ncbi:MAG TPA: phosphatase PAP2-related protein [Thermoanaerobaculia bacterium]|nr:phosphatase PAP2-related protein [Thermoanaerobaculia bacterium]